MLLQQILAHDGQFQTLRRSPAQAHVQGSIAAHVQIGQVIHITQRQIGPQVPRQIHRRAQRKLILWAIPRRGLRDGVSASLLLVELYVQIGIQRPQAPPLGELPISCQFSPIGFPMQLVGRDEGDYQVRWERRRFEKWGPGFEAPQVVVHVIKRCEVQGKPLVGCMR